MTGFDIKNQPFLTLSLERLCKHLGNVFFSVLMSSFTIVHQFNTWSLFIEDSRCFIHAQTLVLSSWSNCHSLEKTSPVFQHVLFPTLQTAQRKRLRNYPGYPWCNIHDRSRVLNDYSKLETKLVERLAAKYALLKSPLISTAILTQQDINEGQIKLLQAFSHLLRGQRSWRPGKRDCHI